MEYQGRHHLFCQKWEGLRQVETINCNENWRRTALFHHIILSCCDIILSADIIIIILVLGSLEPVILMTTQEREVGWLMFTIEDFLPCGRKPVFGEKTDAVAMWMTL